MILTKSLRTPIYENFSAFGRYKEVLEIASITATIVSFDFWLEANTLTRVSGISD